MPHQVLLSQNKGLTILCMAAVLSATFAGLRPGASGAEDAALGPVPTRSRRPVALAFSRDGTWLFVANRGSGSLSVVDPREGRVVSGCTVGRGLADVAVLADGRHLLAVDQAADALLVLEFRDGSARVVERLAVAADPVTVLAWDDGSLCAVASLGSRRLSLVDLTRGGEEGHPTPRVARSLELPFSPRAMALVRQGSRLVVADGFGGKIAVVDPAQGILESVHTLPAHNIRGLAPSADGRTLVVAHQVLHRLARTSFEDVHWGSLLSNHLRVLRVDAVLSARSDADLLRGSRMIDLGGVGDAAGDPSGLAFGRDGNVVVALAGVDAVALGRDPSAPLIRVGVGRRPTAVATGPDGGAAYVTDTLDDTVSVVDITTGLRVRTISLGPRPEPTLVDRGERLFYDAKLSHDGWMSCHSCHTDGHANGLLSDTLGDGSYGAPKRVPSLLGVGSTGPWTWTGSIDRLEAQVRKSIETTMRGPSPSNDQVEALSAYLRALPPPRVLAARGPDEDKSVARGREIFRTRRCAECHAPPEYTKAGRYDVGLTDEVGNREFNPPSLRGVGLREPLLHDGRARTLDEVFLKYRHPRDTAMASDEITDLLAFLRTL